MNYVEVRGMKIKTWSDVIEVLDKALQGKDSSHVSWIHSYNPQDGWDDEEYIVFSNGKIKHQREFIGYKKELEKIGCIVEKDDINNGLIYFGVRPTDYESLDDFLEMSLFSNVNDKIYSNLLEELDFFCKDESTIICIFSSAAWFVDELKKEKHPELHLTKHINLLYRKFIEIYNASSNAGNTPISVEDLNYIFVILSHVIGIAYIWLNLYNFSNSYIDKFFNLLKKTYEICLISGGKSLMGKVRLTEIYEVNLKSGIEESDSVFYDTLETINKCNPDVLTWDRHQLLNLTNVNWAQIKEWEEKCKKLQERNEELEDKLAVLNKKEIGCNADECNSNMEDANKKEDMEDSTNLSQEIGEAAKTALSIPKEYYLLKDKVLVSSNNAKERLAKGVALIDTNSPTKLGILYLICKEHKIIKDSSSTDFVRVLIALGHLKNKDEKDIDNKANGMNRKMNSIKGKYNQVPIHTQWKSNDSKVGADLYNVMK